IIEITVPKEINLPTGQDWTIRYQYKGEDPVSTQVSGLGNQTYRTAETKGYFVEDIIAINDSDYGGSADSYQHYAVTQHTAGAADGEMLTISIVDGFGQPVQVKKTHYVNGNDLKWLVSVFEEKDVLGRAVKTYLPQLQDNTNNNLNTAALTYLNPGQISTSPLRTEYDAKDRPIKITQPEETEAAHIQYSIEGDRAISHTTNEKGQTLTTYTDVRGQQRSEERRV